MGRVLYVHTQALRAEGPHARRTFQMLGLLARAGHVVDVVTLPGGDAWPRGLAHRVYRTPPVPFVRTLPPYGGGVRRAWATAAMGLAASALLLHGRYDAIHCADRSVRLGAALAWLFGKPLVFEWRTASGHDLALWAKRRGRRLLRSVGLVVADAPLPPAALRESGLQGRVATIPPLPAPSIRPLPPPPARPAGAAHPFRLAALSLSPDLDDLAALTDCLPRLLDRPTVRVAIAGGTPKAAERLRQALAARLPATAALEVRPAPTGAADFLGFVAGADLVFLPAAHGPLPPPELLDAMAARRAILAIRCPAYEGLLDASNAMLAPADARRVAAAVLAHLRHPSLCAEHACAAAETLARDRSEVAAAEALRRCYALALGRQGGEA